MALDLLFDHFDQLITQPEDIPRLNGAILQLAMQGKLLPQDPADEPASELLKRIRTEKDRLLLTGQLRRDTPLPPIGEDEILCELPPGWAWVRLGELGFTQTGSTPSTNRPEFFGNDFPFIKPGDINGNTINYGNEGLSDFGIKNGRLIRAGSALMVCIGGSIGKVGFVERDCSCNQQINVITPYLEMDGKIFVHFMRSPYFQNAVLSNAAQTTLPILSKGKWELLPFPLPPLAEQKCIVAKVESLLAQTRVLAAELAAAKQERARLNRASLHHLLAAPTPTDFAARWHFVATHFDGVTADPASVDELKEIILQLTVQGKLVPQDPADEPASEMLERIKAEKKRLIKAGKISNENPLPPVDEDEIRFELPKGWEWCRFGEFSYAYRGHNPPKYQFVDTPREGYIRFIQITDFKTDDRAVYVPISPKNKLVKRGEIVMAAYRHIGKLSREMEGAFNVALCKIMEVPPMSRDYIELLIGTDFVKGELLKASGRAHIPSMHTSHLLSLVVPLPPLAEQKRIVAKVECLLKLCDELKAGLVAGEAARARLLESLLHQTVNGVSVS